MKYNNWHKNWETTKRLLNTYTSVPFSIMIPPPNVTGKIHIGHAFEYTLIDTIIRQKGMQGYKTLLQFGTDHAGIATQLLMDKKLSHDKVNRMFLGRKLFLKKTLQWCNKTIPKIILQMKSIGMSVDWKKERFTMDYGFYQAVQEAFIKLYKEGLIYRGKRLINWDPNLLTALSDIEVKNLQDLGKLWYIRYHLLNIHKVEAFCQKKAYLIVATTRPETIFADTCIAVHPFDKRYKAFIGKCVVLPLIGRILPIISEEVVDIKFGTGCVKITPAHNLIDYKIGKRQNSLFINMFNNRFKVRQKAEVCILKSGILLKYNLIKLPKVYVGLSIKSLRKNIVKDLLKNKFLEKKVDNHLLMLPCGDRSCAIIEPLLTDQWFVSIKKLANLAINAVKNGNITFIPKNYEKIYINWMYNLKDWCISRQLWWGHRIPAWYDKNNIIFVGRNEEEIRSKYAINLKTKLNQDQDVLDTWFSSGLWTFTTIGWPQIRTKSFNLFHPSSVLITGFDIIPFWVSRLIMMTLKLINELPFKRIFIHGLIRDKQGQKMSKSKGNVIDPIDVIKGINYGADALRFTFLSISLPGKNINFDLRRFKGYMNFCNKIWNATRFVLSKIELFYNNEYNQFCCWENVTSINKFIISSLQNTKRKILLYFDEYRLDLASQTIYEFFWYDFCDLYLEITKIVFNSNYIGVKISTINTLLYVFKEILLLLHPFIPYITDEIWINIMQVQYKNKHITTTILNQDLPKIDINKLDDNAIYDVNFINIFITKLRCIRSLIYLNKSIKLTVFCSKVKLFYKSLINKYKIYICNLANINIIKYSEPCINCVSKKNQQFFILHIPLLSFCQRNYLVEELQKKKQLLKLSCLKINLKLNTKTSFTAITTNKK
ncbi:Valyl-tRNA synthetase [Candidatus Portiera aleyrodidarum BT-B-HRs]|uniref:valine--tRNA ligase n=1 Tax=Candidatus Portiera aleyrodidarum TaxID=91844 RepID=UPI00027B2FEF|nr:valine--tRNA ligase [Candidatus Portiera aleyrodidarum]AFQ24184.1 valyl-tRNA synthetase [Candidatus Portiera aleyrodidarum BT-B-HRs]AFS18942.1 Valyl-tRNA synthetase [Candidatus Portiera aleyrodidarum BT-QVLC]AFT80595.1 Valyl-tRNA synthetase [Candidatus Portiera aleyrodidarum BT-QVLC]AFT80874.1 Valyl-tRNA synthetase [Candidatus Portiera aleyrodidarum BT-B-HRs]ASX27255.1 valine--tRNA ligase [Candidatus Portiera aleyrodidarum MED (Bemisia tabaci)]